MPPFSLVCRLSRRLSLCVAAAVCAQSAAAATFLLNSDPFAGSTALTTPGRQVVGNELFLPTFDVTQDVFALDSSVFGFSELNFLNAQAAAIPTSGPNVVVLQTTDNDANPATAFNAGTAANLIAAQLEQSAPGFFIYSNSGLGVNRLVFSTDLSDPAADLKILARIVSPSGQGAIDALSTFSSANFQAVPEPAAAVLMGCAAVGLGLLRRRIG